MELANKANSLKKWRMHAKLHRQLHLQASSSHLLLRRHEHLNRRPDQGASWIITKDLLIIFLRKKNIF